jgi:CubicO group peptidase (beta-lactamase class C family)
MSGAAFDRVRGHVDAGRLPAAVLGITTKDGITRLDAFGATEGRRTRIEDRFHLFSITKPLVGITAARAVERGLLTPETPLSAALPEFGRQRKDVVRLGHLVSHTSGISEPPLDTPVALRTELLSRGRDFAAGTASRYSTLAFEGIAALIEHTTGSSWDAGIAEWAGPLGADSLTLDADDAHPVPDAAPAGLDMAAFLRLRHPGAGLAGRAEDLLRIGAELLRIHDGATDGVLAPATLAMTLRPITPDVPRLEPYPAERGQDWGFTWNLPSRAPGLIDRDLYGHSGWTGSEFWIHPGAGLCWVLLTNRPNAGVNADELDNAIIAGR